MPYSVKWQRGREMIDNGIRQGAELLQHRFDLLFIVARLHAVGRPNQTVIDLRARRYATTPYS